MSLATLTNRAQYTANGTNTIFAFPYKFFQDTDLEVWIGTSLKALTTDYTVTGIPPGSFANGGNVVFNSAPAAASVVTIVRKVPRIQPSDYQDYPNYAAAANVFENDLDRRAMCEQELADAITRILQIPVTDPVGLDMTLPAQAERLSKFAAYDANGKPIAASGMASVPVTSWAATLLDDATLEAAKATLQTRKRTTYAVASADYIILDGDGYEVLLVTTGASDRTITLPTVADNKDRLLRIVKVDDAAGKVVVDGEGAETINDTASWELNGQYQFLEIVSNGSKWIMLNCEGPVYELLDTQARNQASPVADTWYNLGSLSLSVPAGIYIVEYQVLGHVTRAAAGDANIHVTLSKGSTTEDDKGFTSIVATAAVYIGALLYRSKKIINAATTTYYLNARTVNSGVNFLYFYGNTGTTVIRARRIG